MDEKWTFSFAIIAIVVLVAVVGLIGVNMNNGALAGQAGFSSRTSTQCITEKQTNELISKYSSFIQSDEYSVVTRLIQECPAVTSAKTAEELERTMDNCQLSRGLDDDISEVFGAANERGFWSKLLTAIVAVFQIYQGNYVQGISTSCCLFGLSCCGNGFGSWW